MPTEEHVQTSKAVIAFHLYIPQFFCQSLMFDDCILFVQSDCHFSHRTDGVLRRNCEGSQNIDKEYKQLINASMVNAPSKFLINTRPAIHAEREMG
jgi:hypothetical protein